jgi:HEPN domain-containing protein
MTPHDLAEILLRKARDDAHAMQALGQDPHAADWVIAFHGQQAVEKSLKAILTTLSVRYGRTHDVGELLGMLAKGGVDLPQWIDDAKALTPFGALFRYADLDITRSVDRADTIALVEHVILWATEQVQGVGAS